MATIVLVVSLGLQLIAAVVAVGLIRTTRTIWAWIFIASASVLMAGRRAITLGAVLAGRSKPDLSAELVALAISCGMFAGIALIGPVFTRLRRLSQALETRERELRELVEMAPDGIALLRERECVYANAALGRLLGGGPERAVPALIDLIHPDERDGFVALLAGAGAEASTPRELRFRRGEGEYTSIELVLGPLLEHAGEPARLIQLRDLSERKRLEAQLIEAMKLDALGRLSGGIAHDFNNVLTVVMASSEFLRDKLPSDSTAREELATIDQAAARAASLTAQLLAFARKQPVSPSAFDLNALVFGMSDMLRRLMREDIAMKVELHPTPVPVFADARQIEQVVMNLAVNARDAMPGGGTLSIKTALAAPGALRGRAEAPGVLIVSDEGQGIEPEVKARLFEPFFTTKPVGVGTGLGLSSSYGIVARAGGRIDVASSPGRGAAFSVILPGASQFGETPSAPNAVAHGPVEHARILLVEDEAILRKMAARVLSEQGYHVIEAGSGIEGLQRMAEAERAPDLLVTDIVMPGMDGSAFAAKVHETRPGLPVLFMTGYGEHVLADDAAWSSAPVLRKPFTPDELRARVREVLEAQREQVLRRKNAG